MPDIFVEHAETPPTPPRPPMSISQSVGLFGALAQEPVGVHFVNQDPDERIILLLRQHLITQVSWVVLTILLFTSPPALYYVWKALAIPLFGIPSSFFLIGVAFYYLVLLGFAFISYIIWFYNVGIVTIKRIVDIDVESISTKHIATTLIEDIQEVTFTQNGVMRSFYDFGDLQIRTEQPSTDFEFKAIPHPAKVSDIIIDMRGAQEKHA